MKTLKIRQYTGKGRKTKTISCEIPESWNEVTWELFEKWYKWTTPINEISESANIMRFLEITTGISAEDWARAQANAYKQILLHLWWMIPSGNGDIINMPKWMKDKPSQYFYYNDKKYLIPREIAHRTYEQMAIFDTTLRNLQNDNVNEKELGHRIIEKYPMFVAIIMQSDIDNTFPDIDQDRIVYYEKEFQKMPARLIYPSANFFLIQQTGN